LLPGSQALKNVGAEEKMGSDPQTGLRNGILQRSPSVISLVLLAIKYPGTKHKNELIFTTKERGGDAYPSY
jgi:hypothetical protein